MKRIFNSIEHSKQKLFKLLKSLKENDAKKMQFSLSFIAACALQVIFHIGIFFCCCLFNEIISIGILCIYEPASKKANIMMDTNEGPSQPTSLTYKLRQTLKKAHIWIKKKKLRVIKSKSKRKSGHGPTLIDLYLFQNYNILSVDIHIVDLFNLFQLFSLK